MRDIDVRRQLRQTLRALHSAEDGTLLIEEMGVGRGIARVDVVTVNGQINGYEIKSASDTLERLPRQVEHYSRVLDTVTIVAADGHLGKALQIIPDWWGVISAGEDDGRVTLKAVRDASRNPVLDAEAVATLLWRDELVQLLADRDLLDGFRSKSRRQLAERAANCLRIDDLTGAVRTALKRRSNWPTAQPLA